ncbi:MAG: hypothetical protein R3B74_01645 [Nitrospirales bacterium]|nr:hypothetical protein [Nitrospirales bacterium]
MLAPETFNPEFLRPAERVSEPDPRNLTFVIFDSSTNDYRHLNIMDFYEAVSAYRLNLTVPPKIIFQFETAKNLYLYSWFVYRFYPICEHHALACLELALRERYKDEASKEYRNRDGKLYLKGALRFAIACGHVKHEGFSSCHETVKRRATDRYEQEKLEELHTKGLKEIAYDYSDLEVTDADRNREYLDFLSNFLPNLRNEYAHGSTTLDNQALTTLEVVSEIINQIYPEQ